MRFLIASGILVMALAAQQSASAATLSYADFDLISVVPRSPSGKPELMPIPAREPNQVASKTIKARVSR